MTPNNPTGAVYPGHVIESFAQLCRKRGIYLVIDETYRDFLPQGMNRAHGLFVGEEWRDTVIQLYSFSKSYAIPGHRTGAITADAGLIEQVGEDSRLHPDLRSAHGAGRCCPGPSMACATGARPTGPRSTIGHRFFRTLSRRCRNGRSSRSAPISPICAIRSRARKRSRWQRSWRRNAACWCLPGSYFGPGQEGHLRVAFANVGADVLAASRSACAALTL